MTEISGYGFPEHKRYAEDQQKVEDFFRKYHLPPSRAGIIANQAKSQSLTPQRSAVTALLQSDQKKIWALFEIPPNFFNQRFSSSFVATSIGSYEKVDADVTKIQTMLKRKYAHDPKAKEEGEILTHVLTTCNDINRMVSDAISRMLQFLQA